jgi:hypothetical protein
LANDYVDELLVVVRGFVVENGLSQIAIPEIRQGFEQDVSQDHTQITEEYIQLYYTIRLIYEYIFFRSRSWGSLFMEASKH